MCAHVGNQWSHGVVTARVETDAIWSLHHQRWDLHQLTYPVPLGRSGLILLSVLCSFCSSSLMLRRCQSWCCAPALGSCGGCRRSVLLKLHLALLFSVVAQACGSVESLICWNLQADHIALTLFWAVLLPNGYVKALLSKLLWLELWLARQTPPVPGLWVEGISDRIPAIVLSPFECMKGSLLRYRALLGTLESWGGSCLLDATTSKYNTAVAWNTSLQRRPPRRWSRILWGWLRRLLLGLCQLCST
jgi:hypothetical protein